MSAAHITILHVEDDVNDALLFQHACRKAGVAFDLRAVNDGDEAISYLLGKESFSDREQHPLPHLMLLDLKMPRLDGLQVLRQLKSDDTTRCIPVVILTSSRESQDLQECYLLGVNAYVVKPVRFAEFIEAIKSIGMFWALINEVPPDGNLPV